MFAPQPSQPRWKSTGWLVLLIAAGIYALVIAGIVAVRAESTSDFRDFWENAVHFRQTGEISTELGVHNYLPFFTIFMLPWSLLPLQIAAVLFALLSLALFGITAALVENLLADGLGRRPRWVLLIALGLALPYVHSCAVLGNLGLLLAFLVITTWFLVERGREWEAGAALGLAALLKLLPLVLIVFFLLKRRWRVAGTALGVMAAFGLGLPIATLGFDRALHAHASFYKDAVRGHSAYTTITAEKPVKTMYSNNALPMVLRRLLTHTDARPGQPDAPLYVNFADLPRGTVLVIYSGIMLVMAVVSVTPLLRRPSRWPPETIASGRALRAQFGVWCCLMLLASPLVWTHYLPLVYWPLAWLADQIDRTRRANGRLDRAAATALLIWLICALLLAWPPARAAGAQIFSVLALWIVLARPASSRTSG